MIAPPPSPSGSGVKAGRPRVASSVDELLDPRLAAALETLDVTTRKRFAGRLMGERRSKQRGRSVEFEDFRPYVPGDDLRHIDWNVFARLDRFFIKIFEEEQDLAVHLIVDASESMEAGRPPKILAAMRIAMGLGFLSLVNNNRVCAWVFDTGPHGRVRGMNPARGREGVQRLGHFLLSRGESEGPAPNTRPVPRANPTNAPTLPSASGSADAPTTSPACRDFASAMRAIAAASGGHGASSARIASGGKGVLIILSDFLFREGFEAGINYLVSAGPNSWDATAIQVLSPGEIDPARETDASGRRLVIGDLRLTDCETGRAAEVTVTDDLIARYRTRLAAYQDRLSKACSARSIALTTVSSDLEVSKLLMDDLRRRGVVG